MKISIKPETPLTPLNVIFPDGVPVYGEDPLIAIGKNEQPCWVLDTRGLGESTLSLRSGSRE